MIRKNISLDEEDLKKIEPIVHKHNGNLSAAIREIIDVSNIFLNDFDDLDDLESIKDLKKDYEGVLIPKKIFYWFLTLAEGCLPDHDTIESLNEKCEIHAISDISSIISLCEGLSVGHKIDFDEGEEITSVRVELSGERLETEFMANITSSYMGDNGYILSDVSKHASFISLTFEMGGSYEEIRDSLIKNFGFRHIIMEEIFDKPVFWNNVIGSTMEWSDLQRHKFPKIYNQRKY